MPQIKPGRYTDQPKGYLTYPIKGQKDTSGLQAMLLKEIRRKRYIVESIGTKIDETRVSKGLWDALSKVGVQVRRSTELTTVGRKSLIVTKDDIKTKLPVEIHKIMRYKELLDIQIRVTGTTEGDVIKNLEAIQKVLSVWNITPKECVWSQGKWQEVQNKSPVVNASELEKEVNRLKSIVQSQASDLAELKEAPIKRAMRDDREVMKGILR